MSKTQFVHVEGLAELDAKLAQLGEAVSKGVMRRAGRKALAPVMDTYRAKVRRRTGKLAESGGVGSKLTRSARKERERESAVEVFAGPGPNPQAITEEFGTFTQPPQRELTQSWEQHKAEVLETVKTEMGVEIVKAGRRKANKAAKAAAASED